MMVKIYLLIIMLHFSEGCTLENTEKVLKITAHVGGSVLLPCYCIDRHTKPKRFIWNKLNTTTNELDVISIKSNRYKNRAQLVNDHSPANLSLLISHLTDEDAGDYWCDAENDEYVFIKLKIEGTRLVETPDTNMYYLIVLPLLLLLLGVGGVISWKCRGQRRDQVERGAQRRSRTEHETQDQVMYSTIVHSNTTRTSTVIGTGESIEYATIRLN